MKMNILLTGATGYLGGRLTAHLHECGHELRIITSRQCCDVPAPIAALGTVVHCPRGTVPPQDILNGVDAIIHLAAPNEMSSAQDPAGAMRDTAGAAEALIKAAITAKVRHFLYFSTIHVYGSPLSGTISESTIPNPTHPYAAAHLAAEAHVLNANDTQELIGTVVRLSNGIGAPLHANVDRWTLLVNDLCRQAVQGDTLTLRSPGLDYRDFVPMTDVLGATETLITAPARKAEGIFHLASGQAMLVRDMAQLIADRARLLTRKTKHLYVPESGGSTLPEKMCFSTKRLAELYTARTDLTHEVDETLRFCQAHFIK